MIMACVWSSEEYIEFIRQLRTNPDLKDSFINSSPISKKEQLDYMQRHGLNYWVCVDNNIPIGFIGVVEGDLRIAVHPDHRNKGVGSFMLKYIQQKIRFENMKIKVRKNNKDGQVFFTKHKLPFTLVS